MQSDTAADGVKLPVDKIIFIAGSSKNAGKTTFLNYLLPRMRSVSQLAYLTIGIDGERKDQIFGTDKPVIETLAGDVLITCENQIALSDGSFEVLQVFPWRTVLGKLMAVRTVRKGLIEIAGPENNLQLERIVGYIRNNLGISSVVIDGAVNRITQISSSDSAGFYYVCRVTRENLSSSIEKMRIISFLNKVDHIPKLRGMEKVYAHKGAFTKSSFDEIPENRTIVEIEDFTKIFLNFSGIQKLNGQYKIYFRNKLNLEAFVVNLYNICEEEFKQKITDFAIDDLCIYNPYMR